MINFRFSFFRFTEPINVYWSIPNWRTENATQYSVNP